MMPNELEEKVKEELVNCVDNFNSFYFSAGAGAGKTHALIEVLKYIVSRKLNYNKTHQQVICITYTNVAVAEISKRLGNSDAIVVSTIHEMLWSLIKRHQPELIQCHKEKIKKVIDALQSDFIKDERSKFYQCLTNEQKEVLTQYLTKTKDIFYKAYHLKSDEFNKLYNDFTAVEKPTFWKACIRNIKNFKFVASSIYNIFSHQKALFSIQEEQVKRVDYDSNNNIDRLHRMKFSHETLIEYGLDLLERYEILRQIIIDSYPYLFIDECQDTHGNVIKITKLIYDYAVKNNKKWLVGYFGDAVQNIYDEGVGERLNKINSQVKKIDKTINRRSHQQIIDICNKIRADNIFQIPIENTRNMGCVKFFYDESIDKISVARKFLEIYQDELSRDSEVQLGKNNHIHCLVLTNKLMAELNKFSDVYKVYSSSRIFFDELKTKVLSQNKEKLHHAVLFIYYLVDLYQDILNENVSYFDIFGLYAKNMTFYMGSNVISGLGEIDADCLGSWVENICQCLDKSDAKIELGKALMNRLKIEDNNVKTGNAFRNLVMENINDLMNPPYAEEDEVNEKNTSLLNLPMDSLIRWSTFIDAKEGEGITYHTYHGSKGEEYENVAIIMERGFGKESNKFKSYFEMLGMSDITDFADCLDEDERNSYTNTRNLLYVACSRAIKNLRVLYLDDIEGIEPGIKSIFTHAEPWQDTAKKLL